MSGDPSTLADLVLGGNARAAASLADSSELRLAVMQRLLSRLEPDLDSDPVLAELSSIAQAFRKADPDAQTRERFHLAEFLFHAGVLDGAIEQLQIVRRVNGYAARAFNLLGLCFSVKRGFNMTELAIKQFRTGLEIVIRLSRPEELELRYNLVVLLQREQRWHEAFDELRLVVAIGRIISTPAEGSKRSGTGSGRGGARMVASSR
jgi:hypothetical protein